MLTLQLTEIPNSKSQWSAAIGAETLITRSSQPVAEACKFLAARGETGRLRVNWRDGATFHADIERTAAWTPSPAAQRARRPWEGLSNTDAF